jgi:hypothetical protein
MLAGEKRSLDEELRHKIQTRAQEIWESEHCPNGRHIEHWLRAEAEIVLQNNSTPMSARIAPAKTKQRSKRTRQGRGSTENLVGRLG